MYFDAAGEKPTEVISLIKHKKELFTEKGRVLLDCNMLPAITKSNA